MIYDVLAENSVNMSTFCEFLGHFGIGPPFAYVESFPMIGSRKMKVKH